MFAKLAVFATLLVTLAAAKPLHPAAAQCNTGHIQCCNEVQQSHTAAMQALLGVLDIPFQNVNGEVGLQCNPISVIGGLSGTDCSQHPVCCDNLQNNGVIGVGCVPISL
ncbi:hypothetical protein BN946_scf185013.g89 [Trametes cinnabarina]|uniref:Hydrophobin n=1 Tax=Pycnoporus cinnabarinus TaxID=5643 RepID=A0A060SMK1_PYCCI|nr:hypothetical protein BN946_scf185013.g89 [Trametes cinnabarina]